VSVQKCAVFCKNANLCSVSCQCRSVQCSVTVKMCTVLLILQKNVVIRNSKNLCCLYVVPTFVILSNSMDVFKIFVSANKYEGTGENCI
jgi:hypothetical protein